MKVSAYLIKHLHEHVMSALEKNIGNMIIDSVNHDNKQRRIFEVNINHRFDDQINSLDDLPHRINLDQQNL